MARLIIFLGFLLTSALVFTLYGYRSIPVTNVSFNYQISKDAYSARIAEIEELKDKKNVHVTAPEETEAVSAGPEIPLDTPELKSGHETFKKCMVCHGKDAHGKKSQNAPRLAGQYNWYIESSIYAMKSGERLNKVMEPFIKKLSDQEIKDVALYISKLP